MGASTDDIGAFANALGLRAERVSISIPRNHGHTDSPLRTAERQPHDTARCAPQAWKIWHASSVRAMLRSRIVLESNAV